MMKAVFAKAAILLPLFEIASASFPPNECATNLRKLQSSGALAALKGSTATVCSSGI